MSTVLLLALAACTTRPPAPPPAPVEAPPAAAPAPAPTERVTVTLDPDEIAYEGGIARFSPGSRRQQADYLTYELDLASLEAVLGGRPTAPVAVVLEVGPAMSKTVVPTEPNMPAPIGGFTYTTRVGRVVAKAP